MSRALTYGDFYRTGVQDCGNVLSIDDFDLKAGTPKQIVEKAWAEWEEDGMEEQWLSQQDDFEGLDPHECYENWKSGWKSCAVVTIEEHLERMAEYRRDEEEAGENPPPGWWRKPAPAQDRRCYRTKGEALKRFLDVNYQIVENYGGADYEVSPSEFDAINHKYDLKGKRAVRTIADAVWAAMPVGKPFCLDRIDLDALNDTSPAREAGIAFRLPDSVYEAQMMEEEARRIGYGQAEDEPAWVTEHEHAEPVRVFPALPSMEGLVPFGARLERREPWAETYQLYEERPLGPVPSALPQPKPMRLQLEEQEPGVETYRMFSNPGQKFKVGDIVRRTAAAMRSMGVVSGPINGKVVGYSGRWPLIMWSDMGDDEQPMAQAEEGLELDRRAMAKNPVHPYQRDYGQDIRCLAKSPKLGDKYVLGTYAAGSHVQLAEWDFPSYNKAGQLMPGDWVTVVRNGTSAGGNVTVKVDRNKATVEKDGLHPLWETDVLQQLEHPKGRCWGEARNPPPGEHPRRRSQPKIQTDVFYLLNEEETVVDRFSNLNDALTALAKLNGDGRIALGDSTGTGDIIAWTGPPYAEDGDPHMGNLTIVDARDIRRMFSLAMIRRFNELRDATEHPMKLVDNPAWVTKIIAKHYNELEGTVPLQWLPKLTKTSAKGGKFVASMKEYGCGAYGCVLPTHDPNIVLKLTTDDTEAEFANDLAGKLAAPVVVKYHRTEELPDKYKGREAYLLWRDSADRVGDILNVVDERGGDPEQAFRYIQAQHKAAQKAYDRLYDGKPALKQIAKWENAAREMGQMVPELGELAEGMITNLRENKVFMGDVHMGNLGLVNGRWVVIDPGHIAVLEE